MIGRLIRAGVVALVLAPLPAAAEQRVYSGLEAQALQCAAWFSYTTLVLQQRGLIEMRDREEGALHATAILGSHVGGSYAQKQAAFQAVLAQLPESEDRLIEDSIRYLGWCRARFLG